MDFATSVNVSVSVGSQRGGGSAQKNGKIEQTRASESQASANSQPALPLVNWVGRVAGPVQECEAVRTNAVPLPRPGNIQRIPD